MITDGVEPSLHIEYKASHAKQLLQGATGAPDRDDAEQPEGTLRRESRVESISPPASG